MEMKVDGNRIKVLRLKRSWSQEKLAEMAGLNPRTIQRAESEGAASLRTRLLLAEALQVLPEELDTVKEEQGGQNLSSALASLRLRLENRFADISIYYLLVLALVSVIYPASFPIFFSLSEVNYSWANILMNMPYNFWVEWWVTTLTVWAFLSLPVLIHLYKRHRSLLVPYLVAFSLGLVLVGIKPTQMMLVSALLSILVYVSGLLLLLSLYIPHLNVTIMRHVMIMCLSVYVFIWYFHDMGQFAMMEYIRVIVWGQEVAPLGDTLKYVLFQVSDLVQLIPMILVLLISLPGRARSGGSNAVVAESPAMPGKDGASGEEPGPGRALLAAPAFR